MKTTVQKKSVQVLDQQTMKQVKGGLDPELTTIIYEEQSDRILFP